MLEIQRKRSGTEKAVQFQGTLLEVREIKHYAEGIVNHKIFKRTGPDGTMPGPVAYKKIISDR